MIQLFFDLCIAIQHVKIEILEYFTIHWLLEEPNISTDSMLSPGPSLIVLPDVDLSGPQSASAVYYSRLLRTDVYNS